MFTRSIGAACVAVALLATACIPPDEVEDLTRAFSADTVQGRIQRARVLHVGIPGGESPWARAGDGAALEGFAVDLGRNVGDTLGVETVFTAGTTEELLEAVATGELAIAFPLLPISEKGARRNTITDPYFVAHQRLLAPSGVHNTDDLTGEPVCVLAGPDVGIPEELNDPPAVVPPHVLDGELETLEPESSSQLAPCVGELLSGFLRAATGLDVDLMALSDELSEACRRIPASAFCRENATGSRPDLVITGEQLSTAGIGAVVTGVEPGWVTYVERVFAEYERNDGWRSSYEEWISPYLGAPPDPPSITVEEAAALFPKNEN
jgi:hypothetical protein